MRRLVVGVIGHVDHGKTALVRALTGNDTDRLAEEKARGISITLGFAHLKIAAGWTIDLIDMPGHERFVRTMIGGATGIDAVLLVVAANEGIKPQTVEHVDIAGLLGLRQAIVAVTKTDLVPAGQALTVAEEAVGLLARAGLDPLPAARTSAITGEGVAEVAALLAALSADHCPRPADGTAFLPIDRAFAVTGHGPVVTGTLRGAAIATGEMLDLLPERRRVRVRALQVNGARVEAAETGQRVAVNLRGVEIADLARGMALAAPDSLAPSEWLTIAIRSVGSAPPIRNGKRLRALLGTGEVEVRLRLLDRETLEPGETGFAQLGCAQPVALPAREHVILRLASPPCTIAGGRVIEPEASRRRRKDPAILERLEALRDLAPGDLLAAEVARSGSRGTTIEQLARISGLAAWRVRALLQPLALIVSRTGVVISMAELDRLTVQIRSKLRLNPEGLSRDRLQAATSGAGPELIDHALARLIAAKAIRNRGGRYQIPSPVDDHARARAEADLGARIADTLLRAGLRPPLPREIVVDPASRRAADRLLRDGILIRAVDRAKGKELLFHREAIGQARARLAPLLEGEPGLLVAEIAAALGISRKYAMPLLDHLDTTRFTRRVDDRRRLWKVPSGG